MKIGYVSKYFHPIKGGAENYILNLASLAAKDGHEVHVFTSDRKGNEKLKEKNLEYKGIHIHRFKLLFDFSHYLFFSPSLLFALLRQDLDVIHVSGFGLIWHDLVLILKKISSRKTKFINTPHGPFMALSNYNFLLKILKFFYTQIQKVFLNWLYTVVLEVNSFQWRWITKYGINKSKIKFVSVGIHSSDIERKVSKESLSKFKKENGLEGKRVISCLSRISRYKGIQHVIEVLPNLIDAYPDLLFIVMGRDEGYYHTLKTKVQSLKVQDHVQFMIDVSEEDKYLALEISDIFIFPSMWEAFGIVLLEAMSAGNACISTKTEGGKTLILEGKNGYLYDFGDTDKLYQLIVKILKNETLLKEMKENNRKKVMNFAWEKIYKNQYLPILKKLNNLI